MLSGHSPHNVIDKIIIVWLFEPNDARGVSLARILSDGVHPVTGGQARYQLKRYLQEYSELVSSESMDQLLGFCSPWAREHLSEIHLAAVQAERVGARSRPVPTKLRLTEEIFGKPIDVAKGLVEVLATAILQTPLAMERLPLVLVPALMAGITENEVSVVLQRLPAERVKHRQLILEQHVRRALYDGSVWALLPSHEQRFVIELYCSNTTNVEGAALARASELFRNAPSEAAKLSRQTVTLLVEAAPRFPALLGDGLVQKIADGNG